MTGGIFSGVPICPSGITDHVEVCLNYDFHQMTEPPHPPRLMEPRNISDEGIPLKRTEPKRAMLQMYTSNSMDIIIIIIMYF